MDACLENRYGSLGSSRFQILLSALHARRPWQDAVSGLTDGLDGEQFRSSPLKPARSWRVLARNR
jgi:hypothetical protein